MFEVNRYVPLWPPPFQQWQHQNFFCCGGHQGGKNAILRGKNPKLCLKWLILVIFSFWLGASGRAESPTGGGGGKCPHLPPWCCHYFSASSAAPQTQVVSFISCSLALFQFRWPNYAGLFMLNSHHFKQNIALKVLISRIWRHISALYTIFSKTCGTYPPKSIWVPLGIYFCHCFIITCRWQKNFSQILPNLSLCHC